MMSYLSSLNSLSTFFSRYLSLYVLLFFNYWKLVKIGYKIESVIGVNFKKWLANIVNLIFKYIMSSYFVKCGWRCPNPKEDIKLSYSFAETLNKGGCCQGSVWIDASDYLQRGEELGNTARSSLVSLQELEA